MFTLYGTFDYSAIQYRSYVLEFIVNVVEYITDIIVGKSI